ncbi:unnamed protein product [Trichobilharzia regenti]|uniref:Dual specificity protein phosphatase 14 n=1 Tax=Trichobilharzia regenti TaxID=157069 RepID=A0A183W7F3_TRIRE|nr:unnamed protein product [Trichobilharzia regenti]VDQ03986.1 unnamed protein product [Trichobilharzia regenti]
MSRYSTTYTSSYRPFDEDRRINLINKCIAPPPPSATTLSLNSHQSVNSTGLPHGSQAWACDPNHYPTTSTNYTHASTHFPSNNNRLLNNSTTNKTANSLGGLRRFMWDDFETPISDKQRSKLMELYTSDLPVSSLSLKTNGIAKDDNTNTLGKRNFSSTYTTVVSDKLNPCSVIAAAAAYENNCDKQNTSTATTSTSQLTQGNSSYCTSRSRTLSTVSPLFNPPDKSQKNCDILAKSGTNSTGGNRNITVSPVLPYSSPCQIDFTQMFSQIARINNHLFLSSLNAITPERLRQHGITLLVSAMIDSPPSHIRNAVINTIHVPVEDVETANLRVHFDRVSDRIAAESRRGGKTLVHCMAGVSRSSTLILAYLMRHTNMSLADAYQHVRSIRPCIQPNPGFWRQLLEYEEKLRGSRSVRLLPSVSYSGTSNINHGTNRLFYSSHPRNISSPSYSDMFTRTSGDILPNRSFTSLYPLDTIGLRQPLG